MIDEIIHNILLSFHHILDIWQDYMIGKFVESNQT